MKGGGVFPIWLGLLAVLPPVLAAGAEEAWLRDGRKMKGALQFEDGRGLRFQPLGQTEALAVTALERVRFAEATPAPCRLGRALRVWLRDGQVLTGRLLHLGPDDLALQTAWAKQLTLPRSAVEAVTQVPGWQPVFADALTRPGQTVTWSPAAPLAAGRVGVNVRQPDGAAKAKRSLELEFGAQTLARRIVVTLTGLADGFGLDTDGLEGEANLVARAPGWQRVTVQFSPHSVRVMVDDTVRWYTLERGPGGPLRRVHLLGEPDQGPEALADFTVEQALDAGVRPAGDPTQDEVWRTDGDQLFGTISRADLQDVELTGRFGRRRIPWTELRGFYLRQAKFTPPGIQGPRVRIWLRSGLSNEPDILEGRPLELDAERLRLRHALLGEQTIERARLIQLRP
jgi:hypothetical protein